MSKIMEQKQEQEKKEKKTGKYVYDPELGKVVKVSDEIPGLNKETSVDGNSCPHKHHCCDGCCGH